MKKKSTMRVVYLATALVGVLMILLQFGIMTINNYREAQATTETYTSQTKSIIEESKFQENVLLASLKEEYIIRAKAVAHYLDNVPGAADDVNELQNLCSLMSIDEIHIFDDTGTIVGGSHPQYYGLSMHDGDQIAYFLPMLEDKTLSMCQDVTPNTGSGVPMMYAMTWNVPGTYMVQVGMEPRRLLALLEANDIQAIISGIATDENMVILAADPTTFEIVGSKNEAYLSKRLNEVTSLNPESLKAGFSSMASIPGKSGRFFCNVAFTSDYCICVFLSQNTFLAQTMESLFIVAVYLLVAFLAIIFIIKRLILSRQENDQHLQVFESMSEIYYSLHLVDLKANTAIEYSSRNQVKDAFGEPRSTQADATMIDIMKATMTDEYLQRGMEFTDLTTVAERMRGKKVISMELLGKNVGWIRMSFVSFETVDDLPTKIIVATQIIDEEKKTQEKLYRSSHIDELTGCFNRRAYNSDILEFEKCAPEKSFAYVSLDVNGLKTANDDLGHEAGDELLGGAVECMKGAFCKHGKLYRTGGDEFIALVNADADLMKMLCAEFEHLVASWHGKLIDSISVSYGYVLSDENPGQSLEDMAALADKRMYECKAEYYRRKGIDRRRT